MQCWLIALVAACSFEHGVPATADGKKLDAAMIDGPPADARMCPAAPVGCTGFTCSGSPSCYFACGTSVAKYNRYFAETQCMNANGCLVTINGGAEQSCLDQMTMPSGTNPVWIGMTRTAGGWGWQCGPASVYVNWAPGQPQSPTGTENCAAMVDTGAWVAVSCSSSARYVCEL